MFIPSINGSTWARAKSAWRFVDLYYVHFEALPQIVWMDAASAMQNQRTRCHIGDFL
jgi:hypothetical protein